MRQDQGVGEPRWKFFEAILTSISPLHGLPVLIKNNIATADEMNNTAGSFSLLGAKVPRDATVAAKLRAAGAILLGKTNLSQWANYRSANSSNGWSAYGGQTYGAYYPGQDPSGSSSGSGVSASLGLAFGTLGTETDGSIVSPSELNNVVGIKPTVRIVTDMRCIADNITGWSDQQSSRHPYLRTPGLRRTHSPHCEGCCLYPTSYRRSGPVR